jgi:hypothetical protein
LSQALPSQALPIQALPIQALPLEQGAFWFWQVLAFAAGAGNTAEVWSNRECCAPFAILAV